MFKNFHKSFKSFLTVSVLLAAGMAVFFLSAVFVLSLRLKANSKVAVPQLVGKSYLDEHNMLQKKGFKIELSGERSLLYPYGFILAQSLPAGKIVPEGAKITLTVNQSQTILKTPNLVRIKISLVESMLRNIHYGPYTFSLRVGVITFVQSNHPYGEILAQYPYADTQVSPDTPVHLLVSGKPDELHSAVGDSIEITKALAFLQKKPLEIKSQEAKKAENFNMVLQLQNKENRLLATVGKNSEKSKHHVYRLRWVNPVKLGIARGVYTVARIQKPATDTLVLPKKNLKANLKENTKEKQTDDTTGSAESKSSAKEQDIRFSDFTYLYITSEDIPLYEDTEAEYAFWQGKHSPQEVTSLEYKTIRLNNKS